MTQQLELELDFGPYEHTYSSFVESLWQGSPAMGPRENDLNFIGLAITEEAGEVAGKLKKRSRGDGNITDEMIAKELGDVLYYTVKLGMEIGYNLNDLCVLNMQKLSERKNKGTLKGSGDNR